MPERPPQDPAIDRQAAPMASVLVVDDGVDNLRLLSDLLGKHGYEVRAVTSGRQALQAVERDPPDLILLDITMRDMNGYEVCQRLKANDRSKNVPVIFLTSLTDTADKVRAFDAGGVDYVTKPFQFDEVLARVKAHVALRRAQADLADSYARLRALEQLRDDLVRMVVHDMGSPLQALSINLMLLQGAVSEDSRDILHSATKVAEELSQMISDLSDVSRLEESRMPMRRAVWDLTDMARDVRAVLGAIDAERLIDVESAGAVEVSCDGALVRRVIENLVTNALRHTPAGSPIRISLASGEGRARVAVHDQGRGVPPEATERIFQKFGMVESRQDHAYRSMGLGLAFCKLAIEAHGGTIGVEPGAAAGSTFWFELPSETNREPS